MPSTRSASRPTGRHAPTAPAPRRTGSPAVGIAVILVVQLMLALDTTIVNVALPHIGSGLHFGPAGLPWVLNAYTLAFGGLLLLGGRLGDTYGRRRVFETGLALFSAASLAGGIADTPGLLIAARTAQGVGAALAAPGVLTLLTTNASDESARHRALALFSAVSIGGSTLGLVLGGLVTEYGSWRWTLFINVPLGLTVLVLARLFVTETPRRPGRFDTVGAVAATGAAVFAVWAPIGAPDHGWTSPRTVAAFVIGIVCVVVLVVTERRVSAPLLPPVLLHSWRRLGGLAVIVSVYAVGAVPGAFVPGVRAAFFTAGALTVVACLTAALLRTAGRRPASASR
ncbi:MFS transporter [Streptomyces sp. NPDC044984]|uniref:MFS transporter n=1 Tax=Streptomyces sp. NPDC044984 TaxID=3154335 RepID=UPI0033FEBEAD